MQQPNKPKRRHTRCQLAELQVREYIEQYHPEFSDAGVDVKLSPGGGGVASVRKASPGKRKQ